MTKSFKSNLDFNYRDLRVMGIEGSSNLAQIVYGPMHTSPFTGKLKQTDDGNMILEVSMSEGLANDIMVGLKLVEMEREKWRIMATDGGL